MSRRVGGSLPALSGMFTRAEVAYAWPRPDGAVGSDREPVAVFTGEAVHAYLGKEDFGKSCPQISLNNQY